MKFTAIVKAAALLGAALMISGQTNRNWPTVVAETADGGHRIGNPEAKVRLVEFVSYTCPHCAEFTREADDRLKLAYVTPGQLSLEIRHLIRDPVDLTVVMLVNCGPTEKFAQNHNTFMLQQSRWIASDFGFYRMMEQRGYNRPEVDRCLADDAAARQFAERSQKDWDKPGIDATPSFSINGVVMPGTHTWAELERQLGDFL